MCEAEGQREWEGDAGARSGRLGRNRQSERPPDRETQRRALAAACRRRDWQLLENAPLLDGEQPLAADRAEAKVLVARKRERPAQALHELAALLASASTQGWALTALDCTPEATAAGDETVSVGASFAPCDQQLISHRVRAALDRARAHGVRLGRPPTIPAHVIERIQRERAAGRSLAAIANSLNADRIPTAQGGRRWYPATIRHTLNRTR